MAWVLDYSSSVRDGGKKDLEANKYRGIIVQFQVLCNAPVPAILILPT